MKNYIQTAKQYIKERSDTFIGTGVLTVLVGIVLVVIAVNHFSGPVVVYQPAKACDLFTPAEAQDLLGDKVISVESNNPVIKDDFATSKCGYSDSNPDKDAMRVTAVAIRSAINDEGDLQNQNDFAKAKSNNIVDTIKGFGDDAYFNRNSGQMNILDGKKWIILNFGTSSTPETNTAEDAVKLAQKVIK